MATVSRSASGTGHGNTVTFAFVKIIFQVFPGIKGTDDQRGIPDVPYTITTDYGKGVSTTSTPDMKTLADGSIIIVVPSNTPVIITIFDTEYSISTLKSIEFSTTIKGVQRRLSLLGYELGDPDGSIGKKSDRALLNFQADSNLNADGRIDFFTQNQILLDFGE